MPNVKHQQSTSLLLGATVEQLGNTVHPHPTLSEALMEAAHALCGHAIHI